MSTLVTQNISNGTVSTSSENVIQGSAKAWVNFNGQGTVAIRSSYNVSSITDNGTGDYTINFTNALPNADYAAVGSCWYQSGSYGVFLNARYGTPTSSACQILCSTAGATYDCVDVNLAIFD